MTKAQGRLLLTTCTLVAGLAGSTEAFARTPGIAPRAEPGTVTAAEAAPIHSVRGVVKSVDATSLVIAGSRTRARDLVFVLNPSTLREGTIAVGSTVSVRYRVDGHTLVATAVTARGEAPKEPG